MLAKTLEMADVRLQEATREQSELNRHCEILKQEYKMVTSGKARFVTEAEKSIAIHKLKSDLRSGLKSLDCAKRKEAFCLKMYNMLRNQADAMEMANVVNELTQTMRLVANPVGDTEFLTEQLDEVMIDVEETQDDMQKLQDALESVSGVNAFGTDDDEMDKMLADYLAAPDSDIVESMDVDHRFGEVSPVQPMDRNSCGSIQRSSQPIHNSGSRILFRATETLT